MVFARCLEYVRSCFGNIDGTGLNWINIDNINIASGVYTPLVQQSNCQSPCVPTHADRSRYFVAVAHHARPLMPRFFRQTSYPQIINPPPVQVKQSPLGTHALMLDSLNTLSTSLRKQPVVPAVPVPPSVYPTACRFTEENRIRQRQLRCNIKNYAPLSHKTLNNLVKHPQT